MSVFVKTFFEELSETFTHLLIDKATRKTAVIDSVLGYDQYSGMMNTQAADQIITFVQAEKLSVQWILETHVHADHLTAASYLKEKLGGQIGMSRNICEILDLWVEVFATYHDTPINGSQFDVLFQEGQVFSLGKTPVTVLETPGHTPACISYLVDNKIFVGDTLFMPDLGTARTDFPGGSAAILYQSIQKIYDLPDSTQIYLCHDYPGEDRRHSYLTTVGEQKASNVLLASSISQSAYVAAREAKDKGKTVPKMLLSSIQTNLRAGSLPAPEGKNKVSYMKIPVNILDKVSLKKRSVEKK